MIPARVAWGTCLLGFLFGWLIGLGASPLFALVIPISVFLAITANKVS